MKNKNSENKVLQVSDINIGENISSLRKQKRIKQTDMVSKLQLRGVDISIYSYNRIEKGTQNPTVILLHHICDILECDMNVLLGYKTS